MVYQSYDKFYKPYLDKRQITVFVANHDLVFLYMVLYLENNYKFDGWSNL